MRGRRLARRALAGVPHAKPSLQLNPDTATTQPSTTTHATLQPPPDADAQTTALWTLATAAPALISDRNWGAPSTPARAWRGVETDDDGNVTSLDVSEGGVGELPAGVLSRLPSLTCLLASTNALRGLPADVVSLTGLTALHMANNALVEVPVVVCDLPSLRVLNIGLNPIKELPAKLSQLTALEWLDASECKLTEATVCGELTALTRLDLHSNRIVTLPASFGQLEKLERLSLHSNELEEVVEEVRDMWNGGGAGFYFC